MSRRRTLLPLAAGLAVAFSVTSGVPLRAQDTEAPLIRQGLAQRDAGKLEDAAFTLRSAVRKNPSSGQAHFQLGLLYLQLKKDALAKAALFRAAALTPENTAVITTIATNSTRLAAVELNDAYAARDRQEAEDARRGEAPAAAPVNPTPAARPAAVPGKPVGVGALPNPKLGALAARAGTITGRAVKSDGTPVPSFFVRYSGFQDGKLANTSATGYAIDTVNSTAKGAGGRYSIQVPQGAYRVSAYVTYPYKGRSYNFPLEAVNAPARHDYDGLGLDKLKGGLVRDFVLKMTGKKAGASEETETVYKHAYYGGRIDLYADEYEGILGGGNQLTTPLRSAYPPDSQVEITLTPQGPLVDGTKGEVLTTLRPLGDDGKWTFNLRGVYPGTYTATARLLKSDGATLPLRLSTTPRKSITRGAGNYDKLVVDWQPSVTVDFMPNDLGPVPRMGVNPVRLYLGE